MINDLELRSTNTNHWKYVDDVSISESLSKNEISTLQSDLDAIHSWAAENDMKLNGKKCKEMLINLSPKSTYYTSPALTDCLLSLSVRSKS
jgi:site-specific recombinase XerD